MIRKSLTLCTSLALLAGSALAQNTAPIKVGMISSTSGPFIQIEAPKIVKAYFDRVNAQGGINGRKVELHIEDDQTNPQASAQAGRKLVDDIGVVANVGSVSALECSVNGTLYVQRGMVSIQGTGVDPQCFNNANIAPTNTGPMTAAILALQYADRVQKKTKLCAFFTQLPGMEPAYRDAMKKFEAQSGKKLLINDYSYKPGDEPTPLILKAKQTGCQAILFSGSDAFAISWMNAAKAQNMVKGVQWLFTGGTYTAAFAKAMGSSVNGAIVTSEYEPWLSNSPALADWKKLSADNKIDLSGFSLGGYLAAKIFVDTVKNIKGDITRESVTKAFKTMKAYKTPLIGTPFILGPGNAHNPNTSVKILQVKDGGYKPMTDLWYALVTK